jgi:hypothetical protein
MEWTLLLLRPKLLQRSETTYNVPFGKRWPIRIGAPDLSLTFGEIRQRAVNRRYPGDQNPPPTAVRAPEICRESTVP